MLLEAKSVSKTFRARRGAAPVHAVHEVSVRAQAGRFVAIVGESGSGKSTLARILLGLVEPTAGGIELDGVDPAGMDRLQRARYRRSVQAVLQDPAGSLNPRKTVGRAVGEVVKLHGLARGRQAVRERVAEALGQVGLVPAASFVDRYPQELSGGQRQRVLIARAIVLDPAIIIADEAVSALDASVKAGVLRVMADLRSRVGVGYVFITHDLPVVRKVAEYVYVMNAGEVVEEGPTDRIFRAPAHPYTKTLLAATPVLAPPAAPPPGETGGSPGPAAHPLQKR